MIDDEPDFLAYVGGLLERAGYRVTAATDGAEGVRLAADLHPDLVLLDVSMPGLDGWRVLDRLRAAGDVPVLMLTVRGRELERVRGLRGGADDYVVKPFGRQELLARIEALLRRAHPRAPATDAYEDRVLTISFPERRVTAGGEEIDLTAREFQLLAAFVRHANEVLSDEQLRELVWGHPHAVSREEVRTYVSYLRRKVRELPIETLRGVGYRYRADKVA